MRAQSYSRGADVLLKHIIPANVPN
jgi:hypothetical protein